MFHQSKKSQPLLPLYNSFTAYDVSFTLAFVACLLIPLSVLFWVLVIFMFLGLM